MDLEPCYKNKYILLYQAFVATFYIACGVYATVAVWLVYHYTHNALLVSLVIVAGYAPSAIAGFLFSTKFGKGNPYKTIQNDILILLISILALTASLLVAEHQTILIVVIIFITQIILSLVKLANQTNIGLLIRVLFSDSQGKKVMELASSNLLVSISIGIGLGGLFLSISVFYLGPAMAVFCLLISWLAFKKLELISAPFAQNKITNNTNSNLPPISTTGLLKQKDLQTLILFTICSSGSLQFIYTVLAPLANDIMPNRPTYFAFLDVLCTIAGFFAGIALSANFLKNTISLDYSFFAITLFSLLLAFTRNPILVSSLLALLTFFIMAHIISMQVKTNQIPPQELVSQYIALRSSAVSIAKSIFALLAGSLTSLFGLQISWMILASISLIFAILWHLYTPKWHLADKSSNI